MCVYSNFYKSKLLSLPKSKIISSSHQPYSPDRHPGRTPAPCNSSLGVCVSTCLPHGTNSISDRRHSLNGSPSLMLLSAIQLKILDLIPPPDSRCPKHVTWHFHLLWAFELNLTCPGNTINLLMDCTSPCPLTLPPGFLKHTST